MFVNRLSGAEYIDFGAHRLLAFDSLIGVRDPVAALTQFPKSLVRGALENSIQRHALTHRITKGSNSRHGVSVAAIVLILTKRQSKKVTRDMDRCALRNNKEASFRAQIAAEKTC